MFNLDYSKSFYFILFSISFFSFPKGLPNAGKSTLLAAITLAKPDIANYPFTTLMPNLGRLDGDPSLGALKYSSETTLADLPGLIEGAHLGKVVKIDSLFHNQSLSDFSKYLISECMHFSRVLVVIS